MEKSNGKSKIYSEKRHQIMSMENIYMNISQFVSIPIFIISLALGLFAVYILLPDNRLIYVYPNPENIDSIQYRDKTNACFSVKQKKVSGPKNDGDISKIPPQS